MTARRPRPGAALRPFLDTSVLLGAAIDIGPAAVGAQRLMARVARGQTEPLHTSWHCCLEFFAVATRLPPPFRVAPHDAVRLLEQEILARFAIQDLPSTRRLELVRSLPAERVVGGRIYDAHIAAVALANASRVVVTENVRHFSNLLRHGVRVLTADEFLESLASPASG